MSKRLTRTAREMVEAAGVDPENIFAFLYEEAQLAADIVKLKIQDFIDDDLVRAGHNRSLEGYTARMDEIGYTPVEIGGEIFHLPNYQLSVEARPEHQALAKPINVFEILDKGREELPRLPKGKWYPLWSNLAGGGFNVPERNQRVRGSGGRFTTQFRAAQTISRTTPLRPEPRGGPGKDPRIPKPELRGIKFFGKGPYPATPPRNLYKRMLKSIQAEIKRRGDLPIEVSLVDGD